MLVRYTSSLGRVLPDFFYFDKMDSIQGIQMIGTQRSGSNLLRVMLDELDVVFAPHPPHILERFLPLLPKYGDLEDKANFDRLAMDVCELVTINPVPWEGVRIDAEEIIHGCRQLSLYELFRVIYETAARQLYASFWLCKSMKNMFYADGIESTGIRPYYIYLYRDGRDVALSFKKAIVGEKHMYALAQQWKKDQEEALRLQKRIEPGRFYMLNYETLIARPEETMQALCDFLHLSYSDKMMDYYRSRESTNTAVAGKMWANVSKPILKNNTQKFLHELSAEDIAIFESIAGDTLQALGYELSTPENALRKSFTEEEVIRFAEENNRLKKEFMLQADAADIEKRRPQDELICRIKNY